jgi:hypothetical protein
VRTFSNIISVVFHPLLMCSYGSILFFFFLSGSMYDLITPLKLKIIITLMVFSFSFVLPVINIFILYKLKRIKSFTLKDQEERTFPYILTSCFYFGLFYLFMDLNIWPEIKILIFGAGLSILLTALINRRYKISAHMVGVGGLLGSLLIISFVFKLNVIPVIMFLCFLSGLIATARLYLKAHYKDEIYSGFALGVITQIIVFVAFLKFNFI